MTSDDFRFPPSDFQFGWFRGRLFFARFCISLTADRYAGIMIHAFTQDARDGERSREVSQSIQMMSKSEKRQEKSVESASKEGKVCVSCVTLFTSSAG